MALGFGQVLGQVHHQMQPSLRFFQELFELLSLPETGTLSNRAVFSFRLSMYLARDLPQFTDSSVDSIQSI